MKSYRLGSLIILALALVLVLGQSAGAAVKAAPQAGATAARRADQPTDQNPYHLTAQGRLTDQNGNPIINPTSVTFNLYTAPSGGTPLYTEAATITPDSQGLFTYQLGTATPLDPAVINFGGKLYLGVTVGSDAEMTPRLELTASPYGMTVANDAALNITKPNTNGYQGNIAANIEITTTGGTNGWGEFIINHGGGSGDQIALTTQNTSTGGHNGYAAQFSNFGTGSGFQYGLDAYTDNGWGIRGRSHGTNTNQDAIGVYGESNASSSTHTSVGVLGSSIATDTNNDHTGVIGIAQNATGSPHASEGVFGGAPYSSSCLCTGGSFRGWSGLASGGGGAPAFFSNDGIEVTGNGSGSYAIYSTQPTGDSNYTVYGMAHIHGTNISGANYEVEVRYHGDSAANIGDVLALDGINEMVEGSTVLGVTKLTADNADAAIGVLSQRLDTTKVLGMDKTYIDAAASSIKAGDRAYLTVVGSTRMKLAGKPSIGSRVSMDDKGQVAVADKNAASTIGKVASAPDKDGYVTVFVNLK